MIQVIPIKLDNKIIGKAEVEKSGLYYIIEASCCFENDGIHKLWISSAYSCLLLGTCIPKEGKFTLSKRVPTKAIGEGHMEIFAQEPKKHLRIHVCDSKPFPDLSKLKDSILVKDNEKYWIII